MGIAHQTHHPQKPTMLEKLLQEIQTLTPEQQKEAIVLIQNLKTQTPPTPPEPYEILQKSGFIGCCSIEKDLSTTYKQEK